MWESMISTDQQVNYFTNIQKLFYNIEKLRKVTSSLFTQPLKLKDRQPRWTNTGQNISGFHNNTSRLRQTPHCTYLLSKLCFVLKSVHSQFSSWIFLNAQLAPGIMNWARKKRGRVKRIWWNMMTNHGWQIISSLSCLSHPPLLSRQGWAKQQVVPKRSQDKGFTNLWLLRRTSMKEQQMLNFRQ